MGAVEESLGELYGFEESEFAWHDDPAVFLKKFYNDIYPQVKREWDPEGKTVLQSVVDEMKHGIVKVFGKKSPVAEPEKRSYEKLHAMTVRAQLEEIVGADYNNKEKLAFFTEVIWREMHRIAYLNVRASLQKLIEYYNDHDEMQDEPTIEKIIKKRIVQHCLDICDERFDNGLYSISKDPVEDVVAYTYKDDVVTYTKEEYLDKHSPFKQKQN